jgi:hypothetical protein
MNTLWTIQDWQNAYQQQQIQLQDLIDYVASFQNDDHAWISIASAEQLQAQIDALTGKSQPNCHSTAFHSQSKTILMLPVFIPPQPAKKLLIWHQRCHSRS